MPHVQFNRLNSAIINKDINKLLEDNVDDDDDRYEMKENGKRQYNQQNNYYHNNHNHQRQNNHNNNKNFMKIQKDDTNKRTVYVADLLPSHTSEDLVRIFRPLGPVLKVTKQVGTTFGYVIFEKTETVLQVVKQAKFNIDNYPIRAMPYNQPEVFDKNANLIIKNLELYIDESHLIRKFEGFGEILSCKVERDQYGKSRCFAYLQFKSADSAFNAIDQLNNTYWDENSDPDRLYNNKNYRNFYNNPDIKGKKIFVGVFKKKDEYSKAKSSKEGRESNLYVKNLGPDFGDRQLYLLFKRFGTIKSAKIRRDKLTNAPLGCGFVDFEDPDEAQKALDGLDGYILEQYGGRCITVKFATCKSRRQRKKMELQQQQLHEHQEQEQQEQQEQEEQHMQDENMRNENQYHEQQVPDLSFINYNNTNNLINNDDNASIISDCSYPMVPNTPPLLFFNPQDSSPIPNNIHDYFDDLIKRLERNDNEYRLF